jgi:hypothetical protein
MWDWPTRMRIETEKRMIFHNLGRFCAPVSWEKHPKTYFLGLRNSGISDFLVDSSIILNFAAKRPISKG